MDPVVKKRIIIFSAIVLIVLIVLWLAITLIHPQKRGVSKKDVKIITNYLSGMKFVQPSSSDANLTYLFNGRAVIQLNLTSKKTTRVSRDFIMPEISDVKWSPTNKYIVLKSNKYTANDELGKQMISQKLDLTQTAYWLLNTETNQLTLLNQALNLSPRNIYWSNSDDRLYVVPESSEEEGSSTDKTSIVEYNIPNKQHHTVTQDVTGVSSVNQLENGDLLILHYPQKKPTAALVDGTGKIKELTTANTDIFSVSQDKKYFYLFNTSKSTANSEDDGNGSADGSLDVYEVGSEKKIKSLTGLNTSYLYEWGSDDFIYTYSNNKNNFTIKKIYLGENKEEVFTPSGGQQNSQLSSYKIVPTIQENQLFSVSTKGLSLISDNDNLEAPLQGSLESLVTPDNYQDFAISYNKTDNNIILSIFKTPYDKYLNQAQQYISSKGFDYNLVPIIFDLFTANNDNYHGR